MRRKDELLTMRSDKAFLAIIDDWRRGQPRIPSRSEAVRVLVGRGLESFAKTNDGAGQAGNHDPVVGEDTGRCGGGHVQPT
jgi:hypothetical protein